MRCQWNIRQEEAIVMSEAMARLVFAFLHMLLDAGDMEVPDRYFPSTNQFTKAGAYES